MRAATKREIETAIRNAIIRFEQEFMGRGPEDVRVFIVRDLVVIRLKGVLTPAERQLAKTSVHPPSHRFLVFPSAKHRLRVFNRAVTASTPYSDGA
jgi:hypothetical protein